MSRTYKDRPYRVKFPDWSREDTYESVPYIRVGRHYKTLEMGEWLAWFSVKKPGVIAKKRKGRNTEWKWLQSTPSWWTNCFMNRPQRRASKVWEKDIVKQSFWDIAQDEFDPPLIGNKPHIYYW